VSRDFDNKLICLKYFFAMRAIDFEHRVEQAREGTEGACMRDGMRALLADGVVYQGRETQGFSTCFGARQRTSIFARDDKVFCS